MENFIFHPSNLFIKAEGSGYYMYLNSRFYVDTVDATKAYLKFANVNIVLATNLCLTFWFYISGSGNGKLNVAVDNNIVWTRIGDQGDKWQKGTIDLQNGKLYNITFIGILRIPWENTIAIDDIYITEGTCQGSIDHEETCVDLDDELPIETYCPKNYLDLMNPRLDFDSEKKGGQCSDVYNQTKTSVFKKCDNRNGSQRCLIDLSTDIKSNPECFQLYEYRILHTCKESDNMVTLSATGLIVGLVIAGLLLACVVILVVVLLRRHVIASRSRKKMRNNLSGNNYIGSQDIALPQTDNLVSHIQNDGAANGFPNKDNVQEPANEVCYDTTLSNNQTLTDDEYAIVDQTTETSFNGTMDGRTGSTDNHKILDPSDKGFIRTKLSITPTGFEFAKPVRDTGNKLGDEDQYALSEEGIYDHSGSNRHKELEDTIYNHAVDTIYDSGSHKRNDEGREDTYDHFFGQKTEDDYDISTTT
ncbi:unnamed protein product [Mytilus coruscus]|uniref:MAM domain-containing protein n=1 Tax=Mytilus coruscus TaxID=42192 RepID=A0A6J7ZUJ3_MYTCO|nr:unnamed protein product [Mytilus coruscus]